MSKCKNDKIKYGQQTEKKTTLKMVPTVVHMIWLISVLFFEDFLKSHIYI
jgi:hypothetical protein